MPPRLPTDVSKPIQVDLPISHAGAFVYWVEYDGVVDGERVKGREGYFNIDPALSVKKRSPILSENLTPIPVASGGGVSTRETTHLPLDGLCVLTVVAKWMGRLSEWKPHLQEAMDRGYNMLHFTPLQQRGESGSPFSLADQLVYDSELFESGWKGTAEEGNQLLRDALKLAREKYGLLSLSDVVLNHTANNTSWLPDHPEAGVTTLALTFYPPRCNTNHFTGYSPYNTPHLTPALELDDAVLDFSAALKEKGLPTSVSSPGDIDTLMGAFAEELKELNLWQYYVFNTVTERENVKKAIPNAPAWTGPSVASKTVVELAELIRSAGHLDSSKKFHRRFAMRVDAKVAASLVKAAFTEVHDIDALADAWIRVVDVLNVPLYEEWEDDTRAALEGIQGRLKYTRLDDHGPKLGEITRA
jgi:glycogen debranching enzyme